MIIIGSATSAKVYAFLDCLSEQELKDYTHAQLYAAIPNAPKATIRRAVQQWRSKRDQRDQNPTPTPPKKAPKQPKNDPKPSLIEKDIPEEIQEIAGIMQYFHTQDLPVRFTEVLAWKDKTNQLEDKSESTDIHTVQQDEYKRIRDKLFV